MKKPETRFIPKALLFCLPIALIIGFPAWVMWRSGELTPDATIAAAEAGQASTTVGLILTDPTYYIELHATLAEKPEILILGSSRSRQLRSDFFSPGTPVYTAGAVVQDIRSLQEYLDDIPRADDPKVIMVGLDPRLFSANYDATQPTTIADLLTNPISREDVLANWSLVYQYFFEKKFSIGQIANASNTIGLLAAADGEGYRNDGSYDPGVEVYMPQQTTEYFSDIADGVSGFQHDSSLSPPLLADLDAFLADCASRDIYVAAFTPPFSPEIYAALMARAGDYGYITGIDAAVEPIFAKYHFAFYDFTNPATLGLTDRDMQDGQHPTERGSLMLFLAILKQNATLQKYASALRIETVLASTTTETNLF